MSLAIGLGPIKHGNFEESSLIPRDSIEFSNEFLFEWINSIVFDPVPYLAEWRLDCFVQFIQK